ncbi:MAG: MBL fold metallo-hydrolase [Thermoanaerobaculia bacterium]
MRLGDLTVHIVQDGGFRLDGGAMFGVVPKPLWERVKPADERNRIQMTTNCLLVETGDELVLIDTGLGDKMDAKLRDIYGLEEGARRLPEAIRATGHEPEEVTQVVLTHLHFDHCGWNTIQDGERLIPTFPNARYWIERREAEHAREPNERDRASYDPRNFEPLFEAGVVELFEDEAEPAAGVRAVRVPGHNEGHCIVLLDGGGGQRAVFWVDLVPTVGHLLYPWIMGYDLYPMLTLENKKLWLPRACEEGWLCLFEHDAEVPMARLEEERPGRFRAVPVTEAAELVSAGEAADTRPAATSGRELNGD